MSVLKLYEYPHPILEQKAERVLKVDDETKREFCVDINDFMEEIKAKYSSYEILVQSEKLQNTLKNSEILANIAENKTI